MYAHKYTKERIDNILASFSGGLSLSQSCKKHGVTVVSFHGWVKQDREDLEKRYEQAKQSHMEHLSENLASVVEAPLTEEERDHPQAIKLRELRMKRLQWELEKRYRNVYGNHVSVEQKHTIDLKPLMDRVQHSIQSKGLKPVKALDKQTEKPLELPKLTKHY
ncbi:hypothetical protein Q7M59_05465 (plasmid) [Candidatus Liberibacter asiaticus]